MRTSFTLLLFTLLFSSPAAIVGAEKVSGTPEVKFLEGAGVEWTLRLLEPEGVLSPSHEALARALLLSYRRITFFYAEPGSEEGNFLTLLFQGGLIAPGAMGSDNTVLRGMSFSLWGPVE